LIISDLIAYVVVPIPFVKKLLEEFEIVIKVLEAIDDNIKTLLSSLFI
jgi:hexokinase